MNWIQLTANQFLWHASRLLLLVPSASSRRKFCCWHPKNPRMKTFAQDGIVGLPSELLLRWSISKDFECRPTGSHRGSCCSMDCNVTYSRNIFWTQIQSFQDSHASRACVIACRLRVTSSVLCVCAKTVVFYFFSRSAVHWTFPCGESHPGRTVKATNSKSCLLCF